MDVGTYIKQLRQTKGLSQEELGKIIGVKRAAVQKWECGTVKNLKRTTIQKLADYFNVSPATFVVDDVDAQHNDYDYSEYGINPISMKSFPILGEIACGEPKFCNEDFETFIEASSSIDADFCLIAKGDSMINARIYDGDVVFIKSQSTVDNGEIAAVIIDDEATLKRVYYYPASNKLVLNAENPAYEPFIYINEELEQIHILGKAVAFQSIVR